MTRRTRTTLFLIITSILLWSNAYPATADKTLTDNIVSSSSATEVPEEAANINETRWYQVELLIFKQRPLSSDIAEVWPKNITLSYPENWDILKTPEEYQALYQKHVAPNTPFILLDKKQFKFSGIEKKLQINRNDILFHAAWRQSLTQNLDKNESTTSTPILIQGGDRFDDRYELEGSISLKLLRYLHIDTDLWLTRFVPVLPKTETGATADPALNPSWPALPPFPLLTSTTTTTTTSAAATADSTSITGDNKLPIAKYQVDEIVTNKQTRRMRSYETHYIDHPKFGILVRFTPLDENSMLPIPPKN